MKEYYTVLIDGQCKAESEEAKGLFRETLQEGLKPDVCDTQSF
jgi:pentatricopeptide repeat protein